jgi:DeoR/GlpR family transcriptional regulator of sugar metabolism
MPVLVRERRQRLLEQVRSRGAAEVDELASALKVSASTIRRDLDELASEGHLHRTRGGAYIEVTPAAGQSSGAPASTTAKQRIGRLAAEQVQEHSTIMILAGSTTAAMLPFLAQKAITVVTNGLGVGHTLAAFPDISLVMLGGVLHREQWSLLGPLTEQNMADLHVDVMFAGAYGIHPDNGVTGSKVIAAGYHHTMLQHTDALVVLADASKLGRSGPTRLASVDQVSTFITDADAPASTVAELRERGATVRTA